MVGQKAEQRRHEHRADIGSSHLDADDSLRLVATKVRRRRMDDAGVDRRTAEADQNQAGQHDRVARREHHGHDAEQDQHLPHPDHTLVVHAHREEAVDGAPHRDADKEHRAEARHLFRRDALAEYGHLALQCAYRSKQKGRDATRQSALPCRLLRR